jgi:hypothetical protein
MSTFSGAVQTDGALSVREYEQESVRSHAYARERRDLLDGSKLTVGAPTELRPVDMLTRDLFGATYTSFFEDFYNQIYFIPNAVDLGSISGTVSAIFQVWNARLVNTTVNDIAVFDAEGLSLSGPVTPYTFRPLEFQPYTIRATESGPPEIKARFVFDTSAGPALYTVPVRGIRAYMSPLFPNWDDPFIMDYEFKTDIIVSRSGREQRRALRATSRKSVRFTATAGFAKLRWINDLLATAQARTIILPEYPRKARSTEAMPGDGTAMSIDRTPYWLVEDAFVALSYEDRLETRRVDGAAAGVVTFKSAGEGAPWPVGTRLTPALTGKLAQELSTSRNSNAVATVDVEYEVTPLSGSKAVSGATVPMFNGRELFLARPNWLREPDLTFKHTVEEVDYGFGPKARYVPIKFGTRAWRATYLGRNADEADVIREQFERMRGQQNEFYMPTWENDIVPMSFIAANGNTIRVQGEDFAKAYGGDTVYRAVYVRLRDGTEHFKTVTSIFGVKDPVGNDSVIQTGESFPELIQPEDILMCCWMPVWRHSTDKLTIQWRTDQVCEIELNLQTLEDL